MTGLAYPPFPEENEPGVIADWAELWAMSRGKSLSRGKLRTTLARESQLNDAAAGDAWTELERRANYCGGEWPLALEDDVLAPKAGADTLLLNYFLCALTFSYNIDNEGRRIFEFCVRDVAHALAGVPAQRIGAPREPYEPLDAVVDRYCDQSFESKVAPLPATDKDLGLDIVSWYPFPDRRGAYLHFVGQCATGNNWEEKLGDLSLRVWSDHVNWAVLPVRFFATPFVIPQVKFRRVALDAGLVLDRPRLLHLSTKAPLAADTAALVKAYCAALY